MHCSRTGLWEHWHWLVGFGNTDRSVGFTQVFTQVCRWDLHKWFTQVIYTSISPPFGLPVGFTQVYTSISPRLTQVGRWDLHKYLHKYVGGIYTSFRIRQHARNYAVKHIVHVTKLKAVINKTLSLNGSIPSIPPNRTCSLWRNDIRA
jgi:hypothetical protein